MRKDEVKTKEQTINELEKEMRQCIKDLEVSETERKRIEHDLAERVKELQCFYSISSTAEKSHITLDELYQEVADLLPDAWQYPGITCARVIINNKRFETANWWETEWKQSSDIKVHGVKAGAIEICYLEERALIGEGPFFIEEKRLIDAVAGRLGKITERKQMEEALRESKELFEKIFNSQRAAIFILDTQIPPVVMECNPAVLEMFGYSRQEVLGRKMNFLHVNEISLKKFHKHLYRDIEERGFFYLPEFEMKRKDGTRFPTEYTVVPLKSQEDKRIGLVSIVYDITERKQLEEARIEQAEAQAKAEEVQRSRKRIIGMQESLRKDIAQQIHGTVQNKLIIIMHRLADLEKNYLSEQIAAEVADLRQKLEEVIDDNLRPISHWLFPHILRRGLVPALQSLVDQFETVLSIDIELSEELRRQERINSKFITEEVRLALYRIAEEALVNANKHSKTSKVTVKLELSSEMWLRLTVQDDGCGFDIESVSTGLGTLMMQDYAEVIGGSCVIKSTQGKGTEVTTIVPLAESRAEYNI